MSLLSSVKNLLDTHKDDCPEKAVSGQYVLKWTEDDDVEEDYKSKKIIPKPTDYTARLPDNPMNQNLPGKAREGSAQGGMEAPRRRRARCGTCPGCKEVDCKTCQACRDMPKYGGPGRLKQSCVKRKCVRPTLPVAAACIICGKDGWGAIPDHRRQPPSDVENGLLECLLCYEITHPACVAGKGEMLLRIPNSWECPKCVGGLK